MTVSCQFGETRWRVLLVWVLTRAQISLTDLDPVDYRGLEEVNGSSPF